jgi:p-hydroxybenzoate 3-monooxygenase
VGGGPAGLTIALLLHRAAIPFTLLERCTRADLTRHAKAGLVEYRTVGLLRAAGIAGPVLDFTVPNHRCEFRTPRESAVLDYGELTGGRPHYIYPQHQLVDRLCLELSELGADVRYGHTVDAVQPGRLSGTDDRGGRFELSCQAVVGCEGSRSVVAAAMTGLRVTGHRLPARWLAVVGAVPPLEGHTIYAAHPAGFAGQMRRGPSQTRYYLEVPGGDTAADWPQDRIRAELSTRLVVPGRLDGVRFDGAAFLDLRTRVVEPMQQGNLFLAGDAAHLITPAGGKGMNLAIQDAVELAGGLIERFGPDQDGGRLAAYTEGRLPAIWRTQAFSDWFLHIILASLRGRAGGFGDGLRYGWVHALQHDPLLARWFAHAYAGVDQV